MDYCVKTCPFQPLIGFLRSMPVGFVASGTHEQRFLQAQGITPDRITLHLPVMTPDDLEALKEHPPARLVVYRTSDLTRLRALADALTRTCVYVRLIAPISITARGLPGYYARRFGLTPHELIPLLTSWSRPRTRLTLGGLAVHLGTQLENLRLWRKALRKVFRIVRTVFNARGPFEVILGGGWPAAHQTTRTAFDLLPIGRRSAVPRRHRVFKPWLQRFVTVFNQRVNAYHLDGLRVRFEPGRAVVADAGLYLTRVMALQPPWVFVDGPTNILPEARYFIRMCLSVWPNRGRQQTYHLAGRALNTMDVFGTGIRLPELQINDIVAFWGAGAYSLARLSPYAAQPPRLVYIDASGEIHESQTHLAMVNPLAHEPP